MQTVVCGQSVSVQCLASPFGSSAKQWEEMFDSLVAIQRLITSQNWLPCVRETPTQREKRDLPNSAKFSHPGWVISPRSGEVCQKPHLTWFLIALKTIRSALRSADMNCCHFWMRNIWPLGPKEASRLPDSLAKKTWFIYNSAQSVNKKTLFTSNMNLVNAALFISLSGWSTVKLVEPEPNTKCCKMWRVPLTHTHRKLENEKLVMCSPDVQIYFCFLAIEATGNHSIQFSFLSSDCMQGRVR